MKAIRNSIAALVFLFACPISWFAAWKTGGFVTAAFSILLPTYGLIYASLAQVMHQGFLHNILSWSLGFLGAFISLVLIQALTKEW